MTAGGRRQSTTVLLCVVKIEGPRDERCLKEEIRMVSRCERCLQLRTP